jgi:hypothetical protein
MHPDAPECSLISRFGKTNPRRSRSARAHVPECARMCHRDVPECAIDVPLTAQKLAQMCRYVPEGAGMCRAKSI